MNKIAAYYEEIYPKTLEAETQKILKNNPNKPVEDAIAEATTEAKKITKAAWVDDKKLYHIAIWFLGLIVLSVVIGGLILLGFDKTPTDGIIAIGSAAVGALVGLFANQE